MFSPCNDSRTDVPIGMRDKRHHVISVVCTQRTPLTRSDQALQTGTPVVLIRST